MIDSEIDTQIIKEKENEIGCLNQQLQTCEEIVAQFEKRVQELEQTLNKKCIDPNVYRWTAIFS